MAAEKTQRTTDEIVGQMIELAEKIITAVKF